MTNPNKEKEELLDRTEVEQLFNYNPDTGITVWKINKGRAKAGDVAGYVDKDGYYVVSINYKNYRVHRLIWFIVTGKFPTDFIDHVNSIRTDNRWINLREATKPQNNVNKNKRSDNTSSVTGVSWCKEREKWIVHVYNKYFGGFCNLHDAIAKREEAALQFFGEFNKQRRNI